MTKKITAIEFQKKRKERVSVFIDDEFAFGLHVDVMLKFGLCQGMEIDEDSMTEILEKEEQSNANNYAMTVLSYRNRSEKELRNKMLQKGYEEENIQVSVDILKGYGYLDDAIFARQLAHDKQSFQKLGKGGLKRELYKKGIDRQEIENVIEEMADPDSEYERAMELATRKLSKTSKAEEDDGYKQKNKMYGLLGRKGYSYDVISKVIKELLP